MTPLRAAGVTLLGAVLLLVAYVLLRDEGAPLLPGRMLPDQRPAEGLRLLQNQPNPFQELTVIGYQIPARAQVTLRVYNTLGAPVATLVDGLQPAGFHQVEWNGTDRNGNRLPGGVYFYQLTADGLQELRRMVLLPEEGGVLSPSAQGVDRGAEGAALGATGPAPESEGNARGPAGARLGASDAAPGGGGAPALGGGSAAGRERGRVEGKTREGGREAQIW